MKEPRPYQIELEEKLAVAWQNGARRLLLVMPTGAGKTLTASMLIRNAVAKGFGVLFTAHREELIKQTANALIEDAEIPASQVGMILAGYQENRRALVQVGSIQTLSRRVLPHGIKLFFIDEAHRSCGAQYIKLIQHYTGLAGEEQKQACTLIGMTATPKRLDGKLLGVIYDEMVEGPKPAALAEMGYLASPVVYASPAPDFDNLPEDDVTGDFEEKALEKACLAPTLMGKIVPNYEEHGGGHRAFCFAVTVEHATKIVSAFRARGHAAAALHAGTGRTERASLLAALGRGELRVLVSVGVLLEGVDCPPAKACIWARGTMSETVFLQGTGRILRPWQGVTPVILDHAGNIDRLGHPMRDRLWTLQEKPKAALKGKPLQGLIKECAGCGATMPVSVVLCPVCNLVVGEGRLMPVETDQALVLREPLGPHREDFLRVWSEAKKKGWRPAAVYMRMAKERGFIPPRTWMREVERDYVNDPAWKRMVGIKCAMRKQRPRSSAPRTT